MSTPTPARHAWIAVLVAGGALTLLVERALVATKNPALAPTLVLLGATVIPAAFLAFVYGRRLPYDVGAGVVAVAALLGGVVGTASAGLLEYDARQDLGALSMLGVGVIEETCKLLVPALALLHRRGHRSPADGLLLGVAVGAGFAALETMGYAFTTLLNSHDDLAATLDLLLRRGLWSPAGHMAWTGTVAAALYAAASASWARREVVILVVAFVAAVGLHTAWDSLGPFPSMAVIAALSLAALGWSAHRTAGLGSDSDRGESTRRSSPPDRTERR